MMSLQWNLLKFEVQPSQHYPTKMVTSIHDTLDAGKNMAAYWLTRFWISFEALGPV